MGLEYFKTQVLLLHSEQRTLDQLSSGFNSRYAVHTATSGIEALETLGSTPIDVIISVYDLPGMSGADALREASKRSPETVCILLLDEAEHADSAVVGAEELFRIVRGEPNPRLLKELVDDATHKVRLSALSDSANDRSADVDEAAEEHIVMETDDSGISVISDGTGRFRLPQSLDFELPPEDMPRNTDILVITRDDEFLATVKEAARGIHHVRHASDIEQAIRLNQDNDVGVVLTDAAIVSTEINELTAQLRQAAPRLVNIVAGRRDDGDLMMELINRGRVYRFLLKPVSPGRARLAIEASVKHHFDAPDEAFDQSDIEFPLPAMADEAVAGGRRRNEQSASASAVASGLKAFGKFLLWLARSAGQTLISVSRFLLIMLAGLLRFFARGAQQALRRPKFVMFVLFAGAAALVGLQWDRVAPNLAAWMPAATEPAVLTTAADKTTAPIGPGSEYLSAARNAREAGQLISPPGANAIELYSLALANGANDAAIVSEYRGLVEEILDGAEVAIQNGQIDAAASALEIVEQADSDNARLTELGLALDRVEQSAELALARSAIGDGRFDDASRHIGNALALLPAETAGVDAVRSELDAALGTSRIEHWLRLADAKLQQGQLVKPDGNNARYYFEQVLAADPGNQSAQAGLSTVATKLVTAAYGEIDAKRLREAHGLLAEARELAPQGAGLADAESRLALAWEQLLDLHNESAVSKPQRTASAGPSEQETRAPEPQEPEAESITADTAEILTEQSPEAGDSVAENSAADPAVFAIDQLLAPPADDLTPPASAENEIAAADAKLQEVSFGELTPIKVIEPQFPRAAKRRQVTGWVELRFTVNEAGLVEEVEVVNSKPGSMFNKASIEALSQWTFEPVMSNGEATRISSVLRLTFALQ